MIYKTVTYPTLKNFVVARKLVVQYFEENGWYQIFAIDGSLALTTAILKEAEASADQQDFEATLKPSANKSYSDSDNALITRNKAAKTGWTYHFTAPEFKTSELNSLFHQDVSGNNLNEASVKFYNINNVELTTQGSCDTDCVKTVFTFEPTWDYEIIGGTLKTIGAVTENVRVWVVAVPDVPAQYGGSKVMVQGANLKFIDPNNGIEADGRASKYMTYSATYHSNKLQVTIKHPAGHKEDIMMAFEVFKA